jgi:CRISPR-associated protein Csb2
MIITIALDFPAGRYHATPWGRNVNEGEVEWPPSPYRLARALVDVWKRRRPDWPEARMTALLEALSATPSYYLPPATASHTRSYLSSNQPDTEKKQLIFDAFVAVERDRQVLVGFDSELEPGLRSDLEELLEELNYLGRSESWVRAKLVSNGSQEGWNCFPSSAASAGKEYETVQVACLMGPNDYSRLAHRPAKKEKKGAKMVKTDRACTWLEALCLSSRDLLEQGWSGSPALLWVDYVRKGDSLKVQQPQREPQTSARFRCATYGLSSKVLPSVRETVSFAERIRAKLMGIHKRIQNGDPSRVTPRFSGKDADGRPIKGHPHAFYLPIDEDGDGRLDRLMVYAREPFSTTELMALDRLRSVWQPDGRPDVDLVLTSLSEKIPVKKAQRWVSVTPFVTGRHYRKGRGAYHEWLASEIVKECEYHALPRPVRIEWIPSTMCGRQGIRWMEFMCGRKEEQPIRGHGCILDFEQAISGPVTLGSKCHFGLGLFQPL